MKLIDNHCHLDFPQYDEDREEVMEECKEKLELVVNSGSSPENNKTTLELSREHQGFVYPTMGMHPVKIDGMDEGDIEEIVNSIKQHEDEIVAVGEIGMDFHHESSKEGRKKQERIFRRLLKLAEELKMPVVVHSRDAEKQVLDILDEYDLESVILHCFNGNTDLAEKAVERNYFISITTQVLYSSRVQELVKSTPLENIILETDAPYLYPGDSRNFPYKVYESLEKISDILGKEKEELADIFNRNTRDAYLQAF